MFGKAYRFRGMILPIQLRLATETGPFWKFILAHPKLMFSSPAFALAEMGK